MRGIVDSCYELEFFFHVVCVFVCFCACVYVYVDVYTRAYTQNIFFLKVMKQSQLDLNIAILTTIRDFTYCAQVAVLVGIVAAVVVAVADVPDPRAARVGEAVDLVSFGTRAEGWGGELYVDALLLFYFCH